MMQKLFDHMEQDHGLILTQSELQDIVSAVGCDVRLLLERMTQERDIARAKLAEAEAANAAMRAALKEYASRCPDCGGVGWFVVGPTDAPEQEQCRWCDSALCALNATQPPARAEKGAV